MAKYPNILDTLSATSSLNWAADTMPVYYTPAVSLATLASALAVSHSQVLRAGRREIVAVYVAALWSMRISEYLQLKISDILGNDLVFVRGLKGSLSYQVLLPGISAQFERFVTSCPGWAVAGTTYARVYRACVRCRIGIMQPGHVNISRTHAARHALAKKILSRGLQAASDLLHHRSETAVLSYIGAQGGSHGCHTRRYPVTDIR